MEFQLLFKTLLKKVFILFSLAEREREMKGSEVVLQGRQLKQVVQKYKLIQPVRVLEKNI